MEDAEMPAELGAAIFLRANSYLVESAKELSLQLLPPKPPPSSIAIMGAGGIIFKESQSSYFAQPVTMYRLQRAFGLRPLNKLRSIGQEFIRNFSRVCTLPL